MAEIFPARESGPAQVARYVVVKRVLPQVADDKRIVNMFLHEAELCLPFIRRAHGFAEDADLPAVLGHRSWVIDPSACSSRVVARLEAAGEGGWRVGAVGASLSWRERFLRIWPPPGLGQPVLTPTPRYHGLDALRGAMMLLGVVFHGTTVFGQFGYGPSVFQDRSSTILADLFVFFVHMFRMPVFFMLAGFFGALLYDRRGPRAFVGHRLRRIGLPLGLGLLTLVPAYILGLHFARAVRDGTWDDAWVVVATEAPQLATYLPLTTAHLWFLYYLLYLYAGALVVCAWVPRVPAAWRGLLSSWFVAGLARPLVASAGLTVLTALTLAPTGGYLDTGYSLVPKPAILAAHTVFFGFGWLLFAHRAHLDRLRAFAWTQVILAVSTFCAMLPFYDLLVPSEDTALALTIRSLAGGLIAWWLTFGLTGLTLRYLARPSKAVRYAADASYWVYLVHHPLVVWVADGCPRLLAAMFCLPAAMFCLPNVPGRGRVSSTIGSHVLLAERPGSRTSVPDYWQPCSACRMSRVDYWQPCSACRMSRAATIGSHVLLAECPGPRAGVLDSSNIGSHVLLAERPGSRTADVRPGEPFRTLRSCVFRRPPNKRC